MSVKALQDYTFVSKYARYNSDLRRRETWEEAVKRVEDMHIRKYPIIEKEIRWAFDRVREKRVLGSQRALQFGGKPIEKNNLRIYNCTGSYCDRIRFFQECFFLLLCGSGTGFSVQKHHIAKLPDFSKLRFKTCPEQTFVIPDSIEGWADALGVLMSSYFGGGDFPEYEGKEIIFDYSEIRPEGSPLNSCSGKAPGPKPLEKALERIRGLLNQCIQKKQLRLRPIDAYDITMHASDAVLSGGIRRSASIVLFSADDDDMAMAKTGNWFVDNPQRARSNNSALLLKDKTKKEEFDRLMQFVKQFGEPGFLWSDSTECVVNPCVVGETLIATKDGIQLVKDLINQPFEALVDGKLHQSPKGFWETGVKEVIEMTFKSGRTITITPNHKIMTVNGWKEAIDIELNDEVVVHNHRNHDYNLDSNSPSYAKGYCLGNFLSDGNTASSNNPILSHSQLKWWGKDKELYRKDALDLLEQAGWRRKRHQLNSNAFTPYSMLSSTKLFEFAKELDCYNDTEKKLSRKATTGNWSYLSGLIAGYFDGDGTVLVNHVKGSSLRISSVQIENLRNLQIILNAFGINSKIYQDRRPEGDYDLPNGKGGLQTYTCQATHELCVSCDNIERFATLIKIRNKDKIKKIEEIIGGRKRIPNRTHFVDQVVSKKSKGQEVVYDCSVDEIHAFDANSIYVHNCVEIQFYAYDLDTGESGWQACNLCEINGRKCKTRKDFYIACKAAAIIGTCQAGYTNTGYLGKTSQKIFEREALLGVSITGIMDHPEILLNPSLQRKMARLVLKVNEDIAKKIRINPTARATCVKPAGTTSCILGTASGIHPHHAKKYIRRVQGNYLEPPLQHFKKQNSIAVEKSVWSANKTDEVVSFCIEVPKGAKTKNDIGAIELLKCVKSMQKNWVQHGTNRDRCTQPWLVHNISNTITVKEDEWDAVADFIYENRQYFAGVSLLPITGDKDYPQAPFTAVYTPREIVRMHGDGSVMASGLVVDGLHAFNNNLWAACDCSLGRGEPIENLNDNQKDWVRRAHQFATRYFGEDVRKMTYCLKDVANWKYWCDLNREYKDIDYTEMIEEEDNTKLSQEAACAGGQCEWNA